MLSSPFTKKISILVKKTPGYFFGLMCQFQISYKNQTESVRVGCEFRIDRLKQMIWHALDIQIRNNNEKYWTMVYILSWCEGKEITVTEPAVSLRSAMYSKKILKQQASWLEDDEQTGKSIVSIKPAFLFFLICIV